MYLSQLEATLKSFAISHRDNKVSRRFSTMVTGGSGIGKTEIIKKIGTDLDMAVVITHVAQLEPGELLGIPRSVEIQKGVYVQRYDLPGYLPHYKYNEQGSVERKVFDDGIERKVIDVRLLGSKVKNRKKLEEKHGDNWHEQVKGVIIFLDEINRAVGDDTKQAIFELPGDYALHEYEVPENCIVFAAANPSTNEYQVNEMDQEKAWMDRFIHLKAEGRVEDSIAYFKKNHFEESIISFIVADEDALMEKEEFFELNVKRTPRSYEVLDNILKYVTLPEGDSYQREVFMGILGSEYGSNFTNHLKENLEFVPTSEQIITRYDSVQSFVKEAVAENKIALINQTVRHIHAFLMDEENVLQTLWVKSGEEAHVNDVYVQNIVHYLEDLPSEIRMSLIKQVIDFDWVNDVLGPEDIVFDTLNEDSEDAHSDNWMQKDTH